MQRASNNTVRGFASPMRLLLGVDVKEEMGFIQKPDIIKEFLVIVDLLQKPLAHGYTLFCFGLGGQLVLDLNPIGIMFGVLDPNTPNKRF